MNSRQVSATAEQILDEYFSSMLSPARPQSGTEMEAASTTGGVQREEYRPLFSAPCKVATVICHGRRFAIELFRLLSVARRSSLSLQPCDNQGYVVGTVRRNGDRIPVIDLAFHNRARAGSVNNPASDDGFVVFTDNGLALAADQVTESLLLDPEDISWRTDRLRTPWNAGLDSRTMHAVVDVDQLAALFLHKMA